MQSKATTVKEYLAELPEDRRKMIEALRKVIRKNIDKDFKEGIQYGAIGYFLPHSKYPAGYHCDPQQPLPFAGLASQKQYLSLSMFCVYANPKEQQRLKEDWAKSGKKLDMGKSCIRLKKLEDIPLDVIGRAFKRITAKAFVKAYEDSLSSSWSRRSTGKKKATKKKKAARKATTKKAASKKKASRKKSRTAGS